MRFEDYPQAGASGWSLDIPLSLPRLPAAPSRPVEEPASSRSRPRTSAPGEDDETRFFRILGIGKPALAAAKRRAAINATTIEAELMAARLLDPAAYYEAIAGILGLPYLRSIPPASVVVSDHIDAQLRRPLFLRTEMDGGVKHVIAPSARHIMALSERVRRHPALSERLAIASPAAIREAVWACRAEKRAEETVRRLFECRMNDSARIVLTGRQGIVFGLCLAGLAIAGALAPSHLLSTAHVVLSAFFFACIGLRLAALATHRRRGARPAPPATDAPLPVYSVVVALHREAAVVPQLIAALDRLRWPRALLDIKLVCEADDQATLAALETLRLPPEYEIVRVPPIGPRTKPKALSYALAGARGRFLVIYDAEDRPHPDQLAEAYVRFEENDDGLAYLQAPLVISNGHRSVLSALFALEYGGLFRGLLPFLARFGMPLPLGGTSNHFRMEALRESGAWDPHNVTEDADLGMRLFRLGYRGGVLANATQEEAPETLGVWMPQRTRWFKGWLQTWLVMMREPRRLWREMGACGFLAFQLLIAGMLLSALGHPLLILFVAHGLWTVVAQEFSLGSPLHAALFGVDIWNLVGGYLAFVVLARRSMIAEERRRVGRRWLWVPAYWIAMSVAAWRAVGELVRDPFYWAKTPHRPRQAATSALQSRPGN